MTAAGDEPVLVARNSFTRRIESACLPGHLEEITWRTQEAARGCYIVETTIEAMMDEMDAEMDAELARPH